MDFNGFCQFFLLVVYGVAVATRHALRVEWSRSQCDRRRASCHGR